MLYSLAGNATIDNVDWTTGECNFDSQDFKDILEICSTGADDEDGYYEDEDSMPTLIQEGKVLFVEGSVSLSEMQLYKKMFDDNMTFIGYPAEDKQGSYFTVSNGLGIYSKSEVKDAAWEFIRTFMTKEYQGKQVSADTIYNIPSRKDALDLQIQMATTTEKFTDEYGTEHEPVDSSWGWDDLDVKVGPSSQSDVDTYMELIDSTTKIGGYNQSIMDIIIEESKAYFSGDKTVDETAEVIQNRVKTYVNENR
jgi:ABC-type glycerol-3-phosphate transport system substrate-binding protein